MDERTVNSSLVESCVGKDQLWDVYKCHMMDTALERQTPQVLLFQGVLLLTSNQLRCLGINLSSKLTGHSMMNG